MCGRAAQFTGCSLDANGLFHLARSVAIGAAVVLTGASPNPKDKDGVMTSHYTMGDDGTVRVCLRIKRGNGTELVINRVLDRVA